MNTLTVPRWNVWRKNASANTLTSKGRLAALCVGFVLAALLPVLARAANYERVHATVGWHTTACSGSDPFPSKEAALAGLASCSNQCVDYGVDMTPIDAGNFYAGARIYSPCNPRSNFEYMYNASSITAIAWCDPGYTLHPGIGPGGSAIDAYCEIGLDQIDDTQKHCDFCVSNPIMPGIGNKRQEDVDYFGTGITPLKFSRTYNSAPQFGQVWKTNYSLSVTMAYAGSPLRATINRPDGGYSFTRSGTAWIAESDVNYKLSGYTGSFVVTTPSGDQETYDGYNQLSLW